MFFLKGNFTTQPDYINGCSTSKYKQTLSYKYVDLGQFPSHYDLKLEMGQSLSIQYHDH